MPWLIALIRDKFSPGSSKNGRPAARRIVRHHEVNAAARILDGTFNRRTSQYRGTPDGGSFSDDASGEVVHQHLKTGRSYRLPNCQIFLMRSRCGPAIIEPRASAPIRAINNARGSDSAHHAAAFIANQGDAGGDEQRRQVDHRTSQFRQRFVERKPPVGT